MELPKGFTERVDRLRDPRQFVADMVAALENAERVEANQARSRTMRGALDKLPPDERHQYLEIVNPDFARILDWQPSPQAMAFKRRIEERLRSKDPAVLVRREELRREHERRLEQMRADRQAERDEVEARLREAGLPVIPELIDWLLEYPVRSHRSGRGLSGATP